jgi:hypothetical protein
LKRKFRKIKFLQNACYICTRDWGLLFIWFMYNVFNNRHFDRSTGDAVYIYAVCDARLKVRWICGSRFNLSLR